MLPRVGVNIYFLAFLLIWNGSLLMIVSCVTCPNPPVAMNYSNSLFQSKWYEIGKIQSIEGGFWTRDCVCTTFDITFYPNSSGIINDTCNKLTPNGETLTAISQITPYGNDGAGEFKEIQINPDVPGVSYINVIFLSDEYSSYYDCQIQSKTNSINYCFHILSSKPTMSQDEVNVLLNLVNMYNLNPQNLPFVYTNQTDCKSDRNYK
eukprot:299368_1